MPEQLFTNIIEMGEDRSRGNLIGLQPQMQPADYLSEEAFYRKLNSAFQDAAGKGWIQARSVAVLPEHLGTWLAIAGEPASILSGSTTTAAMVPVALHDPLRFLSEFIQAREKDRAAAAIFRIKAEKMAAVYQAVFSRLARDYALTVVAGSLTLPDPRVEDGQIRTGKGPLYNACFVFHPDGRPDPQVCRKAFPITTELSFITPGKVETIPVYDTPAGKLAVLICADSWFPEAYQKIKALGAQLIAVPSASSHVDEWESLPWTGYSGWPTAADVDPRDLGAINQRQAWGKYALAGRIASCGAAAGINVFLYLSLWDQVFDAGRWRMVRGGENCEGGHGPALINLWV